LGDIRSLNVNSWKKFAQIRDRWKEVVERARTLYTGCSASKEEEEEGE
jgi:hypothetical protein